MVVNFQVADAQAGTVLQQVIENEKVFVAGSALADHENSFSAGLHSCRPAHNLGGWSGSTPRFPKNNVEIVKFHDFSLIFH